jgi:hypothetical protein
MRLQKIEYTGSENIKFRRYAGSMAEARLVRAQLVEQFGVKTKDVAIDMENIDSGKDSMLAFINELAELGDKQPVESFEGAD